MGGAAGHMAHPFDCREVRNGRDLINFYVKAVNAIPLYEETDFNIRDNATSLKLDGVNASFRLQQANNPAGFMFVLDRGATSDRSDVGKLDYAGITPDNSLARFKNPDHGMIQVVKHISQMLNHDLQKLRPFVEALGIFEQIGPDGVFFDVEYYSNQDEARGIQKIGNVTDYNQSFIAIHGLKDFHTTEKVTKRGKVTTSRKSRGFYWKTNEEINELLTQKDQLLAQGQDISEIDQLIADKNIELNVKREEHQDILNKFGKAVAEHANELDLPFNVHTKIGLQFKEGLSRELVLKRIDDALNQEVKGFSYKKINEQKSIAPTVINEQTGEITGRSLKQLLLAIDRNPAHVSYYPDNPKFKKTNKKGESEPEKGMIMANPEWVDKHGKGAKQSAFAKQFYEDILERGRGTGVGAFNLGAADEDSKAINSAVIFWEAVRKIGNVLKESVIADTDLGPSVAEQEGIVIQSEKICDGIAFKFTGEFIIGGQESEFRKDAPQPVTENNIRYGDLLESFMIEDESLLEEKQPVVVLIPGGFKPPTNGHYSMIKQYEKRPDVLKVIVVTGFKPRKEPGLTVTYGQSKAIFDTYGGFSDKVEFRDQGSWPTPMRTCYELINDKKFVSDFAGAAFAMGASDKDGDKERITGFYNHFQNKPPKTGAQVMDYNPAEAFEVDGHAASATRMRKAFVSGDWEEFKKLLPNESFYDDVIQILNNQEGGPVNENFLLAVPQSFLVEKKLTAAEFKKKKQIAKAIEKDNPGMPDNKKYAIATDTAKRVAEEAIHEEIDPQTEEVLRSKIQQALANVLAYLPNFENEDKGDMLASIGPAVLDQLMSAVAEKESQQKEPEKEAEEIQSLATEEVEPLEEISTVAGIAGHSGTKSPWLTQEK